MSEKETGPFFVWVEGSGDKPSPRKWGELDYGVGGWKRVHVLATHRLTDLEFKAESLDALARRFPYPTPRAA